MSDDRDISTVVMIPDALRVAALSVEQEGYWPVDPALLRLAADEIDRLRRRLTGAIAIHYETGDVWLAGEDTA